MEIQHLTHRWHEHRLLLVKDGMTISNMSIKCELCSRSTIAGDPFYGCDSCQYYLHKSCAELPLQLYHSFHPAHSLTLLDSAYTLFCDSCERVVSTSLFYKCINCSVYLDVNCSSTTHITLKKTDEDSIIQHSGHHHPLHVLDKVHNMDTIHCFGCQSKICSMDHVYGCTECNYFLHKSCAESPKEMQYPFHWDHGPLSLNLQYFWFDQCTLCKETLKNSFTYKCGECTFRLCLKCSAIKMRPGSIKFENHEHSLCYMDNMIPMDNHCSIQGCYGKKPSTSHCKELSYTSSCETFCLECNFRMHLLCGPLPPMIKDESHIHPLILVDSMVEDSYEDFYCDICENERDPRIRVYYCQPCKFIGHVHCLKSKIIKILTGELQNVELKNIGDDIWKLNKQKRYDNHSTAIAMIMNQTSLTLNDIINGLPKDIRTALKSFYKWEDNSFEFKGQSENKRGGEDIDWIIQLSHFTNKDFQEFCNELDEFYSTNIIELKPNDLGVKIVSVGDYKIPFTLVPIFNKLLDQYGDVGITENNWRWKCIIYSILCEVIKEMCSTMVADITKHHLQQWYYHLTFVKVQGLNIYFAIAHLEKLIHAFLGLQAKRLETEIPTKVREKVAELKEEIEKEMSKLKKCEEYNDKSLPKSELMKDCWNKASAMKFKNACEGLITTDNDRRLLHFLKKFP
ncbi:hypothetical protein CsatB_002540 [Cannabis sativa]